MIATVSRVLVGIACCAALVACERPPMESTQGGFRGLAIESVQNPRQLEAVIAANRAPETIPPSPPGTPLASDVLRNVPALGHLESAQFIRLMATITTWVSPEQGCNYCHVADLAEDQPYTKLVSRRMIEMTQDINSNWADHVGDTGVTCYTCHRGEPVPGSIWYTDPGPRRAGGFSGVSAGQNLAAAQVGTSSLPFDPFTKFLRDHEEVRIQSSTALPTHNTSTIKDAEWTYAFMIHISDSLGVNCTYCHNSRSFMPWEASSPARVQAWHGIRMVRHLNEEYLEGLADILPAERKGPAGDPYKVSCDTCHRGVSKPLFGAKMAEGFPGLMRAASSEPVPVEAEELVEAEEPVETESPPEAENGEGS